MQEEDLTYAINAKQLHVWSMQIVSQIAGLEYEMDDVIENGMENWYTQLELTAHLH